MNRQSVVISLILAAALTIIAIGAMTLSSTDAAPLGALNAGAPILPARQSAIVKLRLARAPGDVVEQLERTEEGGWALETQRPDAPNERWPVTPSRVRALISILQRLRAEPAPESDGVALAPSVTLEVIRADGASTKLEFEGRPLGGVVAVVIDGAERAFVDTGLERVLTEPGPRGWRVESALPGAGADVSHVTIRSRDRSLELRRMGSAWTMLAPVAARAGAARVGELLAKITSVRIERFVPYDERPPQSSIGLDEPALTIALETEKRRTTGDDEVQRVIERRVLTLGGPADLEGATRYASAGDDRPLLVVNVESLVELDLSAEALVDRVASPVPRADIGGVEILTPHGKLRLTRTIDGWGVERAEGALAEIAIQREDVEALAAMLADREATTVAFEPAPDGAAQVRLLSFGGEPLSDLRAALDESEDALTLYVEDIAGAGTTVARRYEGDPPRALVAALQAGAAPINSSAQR